MKVYYEPSPFGLWWDGALVFRSLTPEERIARNEARWRRYVARRAVRLERLNRRRRKRAALILQLFFGG